MPPLFLKLSASAKDLSWLSSNGYGGLIYCQSQCKMEESQLDWPHCWNENIVIVAQDPTTIARYLSDRKVHLLTGNPVHNILISSKGLLFSNVYLPGVQQQIVVVGDSFDARNSNHAGIIRSLAMSQLFGICTNDPLSWDQGFRQQMVFPLRSPSETGIALVTFDLDGVLVESKELHYEAFNLALSEAGAQYVLEKPEHDAKYCGLSTKQKLRMLTMEKGLPPEQHEFVWARKQYHTLELMKSTVKPDQRIIQVLDHLRKAGYPIAVASNCIRDSVFYLLQGIGVHDLVSSYFSNEDVSSAKPDPEIYISAAEHFGVGTDEMLVVEDSNHGKQAALMAGARLCPVESPADVTIDRLSNALAVNLYSQPPINILFPMAGSESLMVNGFMMPKFLVNLAGKTLFEHMIDNLRPGRPHKFIFIARQYQAKTYKLADLCVKACRYNPLVLVTVKQKTGSAVETCLAARKFIDNDAPLMIANLNMWPLLTNNVNVDSLSRVNADCVMTHFEASNEAYSYVKINDKCDVISVSTKAKTSSLATTGYTFFKRGSAFISLCEELLRVQGSISKAHSVYLEDVVHAGLEKHLAVASVPVGCIPVRNDEDIDVLRATLITQADA